ncbi:MAG: hypothetical protein RLZ13_552 [Bacteroidota bacterium]|jgi:hypothetical protein
MEAAFTTKELIELVDTVVENFDPTPVRISGNFPLRWESNLFSEDYDFSENYLDLDQKYECSAGPFLRSVGTAIEISQEADGSYGYWDGIFMLETHAWCSKLNSNAPSFSLIQERFATLNDLKAFLIETYG